MFSIRVPPAEGGIYTYFITAIVTKNCKRNVTSMVRVCSARWRRYIHVFYYSDGYKKLQKKRYQYGAGFLCNRVKLVLWNTSVGLFRVVFLSRFFSIFACILMRKLIKNIKNALNDKKPPHFKIRCLKCIIESFLYGFIHLFTVLTRI